MSLTTTRGQVRWLAHAALLSPAPARPRGRTDWRATAELLSAGLIAPAAHGYALAGAATEWAAIPRDALARLADIESIDAARAILSVFGTTAILDQNGTNPPENGTNPPNNGRRTAKNGSITDTKSVVVAFPKTERRNSNSCSTGADQLLCDIGVSAAVARLLATQFDPTRIADVVAAAARAKDPAAWAVSALRGNYSVDVPRARALAVVHEPIGKARNELWAEWKIVVKELSAKLPTDAVHFISALHTVREGELLRLLAPNPIAMKVAINSADAIERCVRRIDSRLRVEFAIGSAYAA